MSIYEILIILKHNFFFFLVDKCPECLFGSLDFSQPAWDTITGVSPGRVKISWTFTDCGAMIDNEPAKLAIKEGSNPWWFAFQISNTKNVINNVKLNEGLI
jgi:expansin (peptidoglycan-binding protein)